MQMLRDRRLIAACRRGDRSAFCELYETYVDELLTVAVHLVRDVPLAEDVVQDVFVSFARVAPTFRLTGSLRAYLAKCTANRARDAIRRVKRRNESDLTECDAIGSPDEGPLDSAVQTEQLEQARLALAELPYEQREAIVLRLHGQMKFREIAVVQNVSIKTAQSRYRYGLEKLRRLLRSEVSHETR